MIKIMHMVLSMGFGGLEKIVTKLIEKMDSRKYSLILCCLDRGGELLETIGRDNCKIYILKRNPGIFDLKLLREIIGIIKKERVDVVHSHSGCIMYSAMGGRIAGVKGIIHTDHGRLIPERKGLIVEDAIFSRLTDFVITVSDELKIYLENRTRIPRRKLYTITNGVDTEEFKPLPKGERGAMRIKLGFKEKDNLVGVVCRLEKVKNIPFLIESIAPMLRRKDFILSLVGDGTELGPIEALIGRLDLKESISLLGQRGNVHSIMPIFDIFLLPSLSEGTSMTILEAMASEVPVIASNVGGNKRLVEHGQSGYLFDLNDPEMILKQIELILLDQCKRENMGKRGREIVVNNFSFDNMLKAYCNYYDILNSRKNNVYER